jgi:hypothetical protein
VAPPSSAASVAASSVSSRMPSRSPRLARVYEALWTRSPRAAAPARPALRRSGWSAALRAIDRASWCHPASRASTASCRALQFAETFYDQLITQRQPLGRASLAARQTTSVLHGGDPTWLAYAVYGSPAATARIPSPRA